MPSPLCRCRSTEPHPAWPSAPPQSPVARGPVLPARSPRDANPAASTRRRYPAGLRLRRASPRHAPLRAQDRRTRRRLKTNPASHSTRPSPACARRAPERACAAATSIADVGQMPYRSRSYQRLAITLIPLCLIPAGGVWQECDTPRRDVFPTTPSFWPCSESRPWRGWAALRMHLRACDPTSYPPDMDRILISGEGNQPYPNSSVYEAENATSSGSASLPATVF